MSREKFLELTSEGNICDFCVVRGWEKLPDLGPRDLWDLMDIGVRFGVFGYDIAGKSSVMFKADGLILDVYNFLGNGIGGSAGMMIGKHRPEKRLQATHDGAFLLELLNGMDIIWDRGFTADDIKKRIYQIDQHAYKRGYILGGRRRVSHT